MWYFAWILGISAAVMLAVLNAMWYEAQECARDEAH
jgi:cyd operon protein YbgT